MYRVSIKEDDVSLSKRLVATLMLTAYIFVISPFALFAEQKNQSVKMQQTVAVKEEKSEVLISAKNGGTVTLGDASIEIPEGALKEDTKISITRLYRVEDTGESLYNAIPHSGGYRFLPAGTKFLKDVTITLPYNSELNAKPQTLDDLYTYFYDTDKKSWVKLERLEVDKEHNKVRSLSSHFTDMINATLTMPESASPVDVNLNSIKNLEAAKPDSHLIKFNPPQASNMGDASFSFELSVPAGRHGMQPQLGISYSSAGGNGIMGSNFDLNYGSCITTDTRFGLPKYDTNDTYMLDGILLSEKSRTETTITYQPKREAAFSRIIRFLDDNHWEVTDKSGTKRIYKQDEKSCVGYGQETFTWNLTKIVDVHKNTVIYEYNDFEEDAAGYVYPTTIYYTGYDETKGNYSIKFNYDENGIRRQDVRIDGRSKKIVVCKKLLTSITTHYNDGDPIRKYTFTYKEGLAKENLLVSLTVSNNADESYTYTFDYNDPETDSNGNVIYFADTQEWYMGKDNPLQITNSTSIGKNNNASAGVGYGTKCIDGRITGGVSGSSGEGETYSEDSIVDINGDGRPDAISQVGNQVYVALNNGKGFDQKKPVVLKSGNLESDLDYEKNTNSSVGWNIYGGIGLKGNKISASAGAGYSEVYQNSSSKVLCTFIDMNRDGLADIIESGKDYYLKNEGNLCFSKAYIASTVTVNDVVQPMSRKQRNDYQKTYYVQNPFRMWKAPYEGVVTITETVNGINVKKNVVAKTFIGSESSDKELEISKTDNEQQIKTKSGYLIEKDRNVYFVNDSGDEPKGTDIDWNIDIKFTEIKTLKNNYPVPVIVPEEIIYKGVTIDETPIDNNLTPYVKKTIREAFVRTFENNLSDPRLMEFFKISDEDIKNEQGYPEKYQVSITYSDDWKKRKNAPDLYQLIIEKGYFIPGIITETDFKKYIEELTADGKTAKNQDYFRKFASQFTHCVAEKVFVLKPFSSDAERKQFFRDYPLSTGLKQNCLKNYDVDGIKTYYSDSDIKYTGSKTYEIPENTKRSENNTGSVFKKNEKVYYKIGDFGGVNKPLYFNATDEKIICDYDALSEAGIKDYVYDEENNKITFDAVYGTDADNLNGTDPESIITFELEDISYRAGNITEVELQGIIDSISVEKTSVNDEYWSWPYNKRVSEEELNSLFEDMEFNDEEKNKIISYLYDKNDEEDYYILKDSPDYNPAQKILNSYKRRIVLKNVFPFYEINDNGEYILADFWAAEKSKDDIFAYYREEVCEEIKSKYPNLNLHDTNDRETYDNLVNSALEKRYEDYKEKNDLLIEKCKLFNIAMVGKVSCTVNYDKEHLYKITRKQNHSEYTMLQLDDETSDDIILLLQPLSLQKTTWNSQTDFSLVDNSVAYSVYEYDVIEQDEKTKVKYEGKANITVNNDEFLYGGENNWFYGMWKSSWTEIDDGVVKEDIPFTEETLKAFASKSNSIKSDKDLKNEKEKSKNVNVTNPERSNSQTDINFYLPCTRADSLQVKDLEKLENKDIDYSVDFDNALIGTVSVSTVLKRNEQGGKDPVSEYYMPFIAGDVIHADRAGGDSYYNVEGLYQYKDNQSGAGYQLKNISMPVIRKTYSDGVDRTPNLSVAIGGEPNEIPGQSADNQMKTVASSAQERMSLSGSKGHNSTDSYVKQVFQDVNGDGIPDIIQVNDNYDRKADKKTSAVKATLSSGLKEDKVVYDSQKTLSELSVLGKSNCETDVIGASISPGGNIFVTPVGFKRMQQKQDLKPSPNPSGGASYSYGTSSQTEGMSDINGDGLCDYYNGGSYKLNIGDEFVEEKEYFNNNEKLSESSSKNVGLNFAVSLGIGSSADLSQATSLGCGASGSLGVSYSFGSSNTEKMMMDINGDGLQDILEMSPGSSSIKVKYNTGSSFATGSPITVPDWGSSVSSHYDDFITKTDSSGYNFGFAENIPVVGVTVKNCLGKVTINPFGSDAKEYANSLDWSTSSTLGFSASIGANVNLGIDICVPLYVGTLNITVAGGSGVNASTSINGVSVKMMDLDGDGLADHVIRIPGVGMYWKRNISGLYGKISRVNMPQGGNIEIEYAEKFGTPENPNFKYVLNKVTVNDGNFDIAKNLTDCKHQTITVFDYEKAIYNRQEKEFYGFERVITKTFAGFDEQDKDNLYPLYITQTDDYYQDKYYRKAFLRESNMYGLSEFNTVGVHLCKSTSSPRIEPYAQPDIEESWVYEKDSGQSFIYSSTKYEYDDFGNCDEITQSYGDNQKIRGKIDYDNSRTSDYILGLPTHIYVYDTKGKLLRYREGNYYPSGQLKELKQYYSDSEYTKNTLSYDTYGNIQSIKDKRGSTVSYEYDEDVNTFVTHIEQSGEGTDTYESKLMFDPNTQTKSYESDCNNNSIYYKYDNWQRVLEIKTDYDSGTIPALSYEYQNPQNFEIVSLDKDKKEYRIITDQDNYLTVVSKLRLENKILKEINAIPGNMWYTVTNNKVTFDVQDDFNLYTENKPIIQTVIQTDGLGRAVRTAKTGYVDGKEGWNISGVVEYDEKGRVAKEGMTEFIDGDIETLLDTPLKMTDDATSYEYDDKDRQIKTVLPDGSIQSTKFFIENNKQITETMDPLGNVSIQETDSRGNIVRVAKKDKDGNLLTQVNYEYNELGEMLKAALIPLDGVTKIHPTIVEYDLLGRRTAIESADSGRQEFFYDNCSNLVRENNSVLRQNNKQIVYKYDGLNRLIYIDYPDTKDTVYTYGGKNDTHGAAGRILKIEDSSGTLEYEYGRLGEVTKETRTLTHHLNDLLEKETAVMSYRSDYLGRMQWIEYPDGEKIEYGYDKGGQVVSVTGTHWTRTFKYVTNILYDQYGQRTRIDYGNGTFTEYTYDAKRRWLDTIKTYKADNSGNPLKTYQNITYSFDAVGNVKYYENNCIDEIRGNYYTRQDYTYDNLYQLIKVEGKSKYNPHFGTIPEYEAEYSQTFTFDDNGFGKIMNKKSTESITPYKKIGDNLKYEFDYEYDVDNYTHRRIRSGNTFYKYDDNGNIICEQDGSFENNNDESYHKIQEESDDVYSTDYGWGLFRDDGTDIKGKHTRYKRTYSWNERNMLVLSEDSSHSTSYVYGQDGQRSNKYTKNSETLYFNNMWTLHTDAGNNDYGGQYAKNVYLGETRIVTKLYLKNDPRVDAEEIQQYFYHSDHLGSASLISDYKGDEYQRIEYTPYGETWIERTDNNGVDYLPYRFTGKELDEETGLYYYGARYLDPKYSTWISTDPALGDYIPQAPVNDEARKHNQNLPGMGGIFNHINNNLYHYAGNNPVRYVDPDGRDIILLCDPDRGAGQSHNAVLIGNDKDGWHYFSKDGGDKNNVHLTFKNLNDFKKWNTKLNFMLKRHAYDRAFKVTTSKDQDNKAIKFGEENFNKPYSLTEHKDNEGNIIDQNCADLAADIISAAGLQIQKPKIDIKAKSKYFGLDRFFDNAYNQDKLSTVTCPEYQFDEFSKKYKDVGEHMDLINKD